MNTIIEGHQRVLLVVLSLLLLLLVAVVFIIRTAVCQVIRVPVLITITMAAPSGIAVPAVQFIAGYEYHISITTVLAIIVLVQTLIK